jgi:hypothetical protein
MRRIVQTTDSASGGLHVHKQSMTIAIAGASANRHFAAPCDRFYLNKLLHAAQLHQHLIAHLQSDCVFGRRAAHCFQASPVTSPDQSALAAAAGLDESQLGRGEVEAGGLAFTAEPHS